MKLAGIIYKQEQSGSWLKRSLLICILLRMSIRQLSFLNTTRKNIRLFLADTVIATQHRDWAWIFVGVKKRDEMIQNVRNE